MPICLRSDELNCYKHRYFLESQKWLKVRSEESRWMREVSCQYVTASLHVKVTCHSLLRTKRGIRCTTLTALQMPANLGIALEVLGALMMFDWCSGGWPPGTMWPHFFVPSPCFRCVLRRPASASIHGCLSLRRRDQDTSGRFRSEKSSVQLIWWSVGTCRTPTAKAQALPSHAEVGTNHEWRWTSMNQWTVVYTERSLRLILCVCVGRLHALAWSWFSLQPSLRGLTE